jgi:hypothetical protein
MFNKVIVFQQSGLLFGKENKKIGSIFSFGDKKKCFELHSKLVDQLVGKTSVSTADISKISINDLFRIPDVGRNSVLKFLKSAFQHAVDRNPGEMLYDYVLRKCPESRTKIILTTLIATTSEYRFLHQPKKPIASPKAIKNPMGDIFGNLGNCLLCNVFDLDDELKKKLLIQIQMPGFPNYWKKIALSYKNRTLLGKPDNQIKTIGELLNQSGYGLFSVDGFGVNLGNALAEYLFSLVNDKQGDEDIEGYIQRKREG